MSESRLNDPEAMATAYADAGGTAIGAIKAERARRHKPAFWWAQEREPWTRIRRELDGDERANAAVTAFAAFADMLLMAPL